MVLSGIWRKGSDSKDFDPSRLVIKHDKEVAGEAVQSLCASVGWAKRESDLIGKALQNSVSVVSIWDGDLMVAFGRATGDYVFNATIWDVAVRPEYQRKGIGQLVVKEIVKELESYEIPLITLYADSAKDAFYRRLGFVSDPIGVRAMFRERLF